MQNLLALSDHYITCQYMLAGLAELEKRGIHVDTRRWDHGTLEDLQEANLKIEQGGPDAVPLPDELLEQLEDYDIVVTQFAPISKRFLDAAKNLKVIGVLRAGLENIAVEEAKRKNIAVINTPGRNARAVAECAVGLILTEIRNLARAHAALKQGIWTRDFPNKNDIPELLDKTVGLVGFGAIGRLVAKFLTAFGAKIIVADPFYNNDDPNAAKVDLDTLMQTSDVVSLHARYVPETHHLVSRRRLEMMKPTAILVNTARSGLVDEPALVELLSSGKIMGAALDVFDEEPLSATNPFLTLPNVTIVPHLAGSTADAFRNSPKLFAGNLLKWMGERIDN